MVKGLKPTVKAANLACAAADCTLTCPSTLGAEDAPSILLKGFWNFSNRTLEVLLRQVGGTNSKIFKADPLFFCTHQLTFVLDYARVSQRVTKCCLKEAAAVVGSQLLVFCKAQTNQEETKCRGSRGAPSRGVKGHLEPKVSASTVHCTPISTEYCYIHALYSAWQYYIRCTLPGTILKVWLQINKPEAVKWWVTKGHFHFSAAKSNYHKSEEVELRKLRKAMNRFKGVSSFLLLRMTSSQTWRVSCSMSSYKGRRPAGAKAMLRPWRGQDRDET